jgi:magnesium transporter
MKNHYGKILIRNHNLFQKKAKAKKALQIPDSLDYTGIITDNIIEIKLMTFDIDNVASHSSDNIEEIISKIDENKVNWINIDAIYNTDIIKSVGEHFLIHHLILEDILNTEQLPKVDFEDNYLFLTMKILTLNPVSNLIDNEHISFLLGKNYVISFQEKKGDIFNGIRERILDAKGRVRKRSSDYLFYLLVDAIVDNYYLVVDNLNDNIDDLEEKLYYNPKQEQFQNILELKKQTIFLRKAIIPLESALRSLTDEDLDSIDPVHTKYFLDVFEHTKSIIQDIEIMRELLIGHIELYMSAQSNKMNNIMKTLTVIASIFIPLTFLAGVYGMNFKYMPELDWKYGYPLILFSMCSIGIIMFIYMKRKHWF